MTRKKSTANRTHAGQSQINTVRLPVIQRPTPALPAGQVARDRIRTQVAHAVAQVQALTPQLCDQGKSVAGIAWRAVPPRVTHRPQLMVHDVNSSRNFIIARANFPRQEAIQASAAYVADDSLPRPLSSVLHHQHQILDRVRQRPRDQSTADFVRDHYLTRAESQLPPYPAAGQDPHPLYQSRALIPLIRWQSKREQNCLLISTYDDLDPQIMPGLYREYVTCRVRSDRRAAESIYQATGIRPLEPDSSLDPDTRMLRPDQFNGRCREWIPTLQAQRYVCNTVADWLSNIVFGAGVDPLRYQLDD